MKIQPGQRVAGVQAGPDSAGPSWLTVLGHAEVSLWSLDFVSLRIDSLAGRIGFLVVMDHCTRRIVGFGVHRGVVDASRCAESSIERRAARLRQHTSARTMIRCIGSTNGNGIFESSTCKKSRPSRTRRLSHPFV